MNMKSKEDKHNPKVRQVNIDKYILDSREKETYKLLTQLDYIAGYPNENGPKSFMVFLAHKESSMKKSSFLKYFCHDEIKDLAAFKKLGFPLK